MTSALDRSSSELISFSDTLGVHVAASILGTASLYVYLANVGTATGNEVYMQTYWFLLLPLACLPGALFYLVLVMPFTASLQGQAARYRWLSIPLATGVAAGVPYFMSGSAASYSASFGFGLCAFVGSATHLVLFSLFRRYFQ